MIKRPANSIGVWVLGSLAGIAVLAMFSTFIGEFTASREVLARWAMLVAVTCCLVAQGLQLRTVNAFKRRVKEARGDICPHCHYDTPVRVGDRCPECGTVFSDRLIGEWERWWK